MSGFLTMNTLEQNFHDWDRKRIERRNNYWKMIRQAKSDWLKLTDQAALEYELGEGAFYYYLQQNYGLKMELIDGKIGGQYEVVDEKKYTMFLLKYGS